MKERSAKMVIGRKVLRFGEVASTNDLAKAMGKEGEEEGLVIIAKSQAKGKGRMGRTWSSPEGGLYLSILLRPRMSTADLMRMTVFSCVPVAKAIEQVSGIEVQIKWPNDLVVRGMKVAGILVEGVSKGADLDFAVIGIGVNANSMPQEIGEEGATSLRQMLGKELDLEELAQAILVSMERFYQVVGQGGTCEEQYVRRSAVLGKEIEAKVGKETIRGKALYLAPDGALVIKSEEGLVLRLSWVNETSIRTTNSEELNGISLRKD